MTTMTNTTLTVAAVQMNSGPDKSDNVKRALRLCNQAVEEGARLIALPEMFNRRTVEKDHPDYSELIPGESIFELMALAKRHRVAILAGSVCEKIPGESKVYNTSVLINDAGKIISLYRKIHLFDVDVAGKVFRESAVFLAGDKSVTGKVHACVIGMSICYDLRFPELYRALVKQGAEILCVPSAFTKPTGERHWHALLRCRAIENQSVVIAPNQTGIGAMGVPSYGHSLILDHDGNILAQAPADEECVITAQVDMGTLREYRTLFPALQNRRLP